MVRKRSGRNLMRQAWPEEAAGSVREIKQLMKRLGALIYVAVDSGVLKQDQRMIEAMRPEIQGTADDISLECEALMAHLPESRRGRYPAWYHVANEIYDLSIEITRMTNDLANFFKGNRMVNVGFLVGLINETYAEMIEAMESIREPRPQRAEVDSLAVWREAIEEAIDE